MRKILLSIGALAAIAPAPGPIAAELAWTAEKLSPALSSPNQTQVVVFQSAAAKGDKITAAHAARTYAGSANIESWLCWASQDHCVRFGANQINTHAFDGLDASQPMLIVHRLLSQGALRQAIYVRTNVTVWHTVY